jgi:hypothetical protein
MSDGELARSVEFAAFLISGALALTFGLDQLVGGIIDWVAECVSPAYPTECSGTQNWPIISPAIGGAAIVALGVVFLILAYRARPPANVTNFPPPTP